jgi:hypothetical protein
VSFPSPEEGNRSIIRNVVLPIYLEFRIMDKVQKLSNSAFKSYINTLASLCPVCPSVHLPAFQNWRISEGVFVKSDNDKFH